MKRAEFVLAVQRTRDICESTENEWTPWNVMHLPSDLMSLRMLEFELTMVYAQYRIRIH